MMQDEIVSLFPTPFFNCFINVSQDEETLIKQIEMRPRPYGYISTDQQILDQVPDTSQQIMTKARKFVEMLGYNFDLRFTSSWANLHEEDGMGRNHIHANSMISGVLFHGW